MRTETNSLPNFLLILILGSLATLSPVAIDLYLPAFSQMAAELNTTSAKIALSLSSYFIGLALGQLAYGPLLDRFGRKIPVYGGLSLFILASMGCLFSRSVEALIAFRFLQALGGCVAGVAAVTMVRDFFPPRESAKIFSLLMLIIAVSPMLAPTVGGLVTATLGWPWVFVILAAFALNLILVLRFVLPDPYSPDPNLSLKLGPILRTYASILKNAQFITYALAGAFGFSGLFVYVAGSPLLFMEIYQLNAQTYGAVFAFLSTGLIGSAQVNILLTRKFRGERIFAAAVSAQVLFALVFAFGSFFGDYGVVPTVALIFGILCTIGISNPNGSALALAPFTKNAGSASAMLGFLQIGAGALASSAVGFVKVKDVFPLAAILACTAILSLAVLRLGRRRITRLVLGEESAPALH